MTRRTGRTAAALGVVVALTALSACAPEIPTPQPPAAPAAPGPVLDAEQETTILAAIGQTLAQTQEARSADGLEARLSGPALAIRESELKVADRLGSDEYLTALPTEVVSTTTPVDTGWPRTVVAISEQPELQTERLLVLEQEDPRSNYRLWGWVRLFPKVVLPAFASLEVGSQSVAPDAEGLVVTPQTAIDRYADVLTKKSKSEHADAFVADPFREQIAQIAKLQNKALKAADGKQTMTFTPVPGAVESVSTADGGAVVVGELKTLEVRTAEKGAVLSPGTAIEKALAKKLKVKNEMTISYTTVVALYVPPAAADGQVSVLGVEHVATAAGIPD